MASYRKFPRREPINCKYRPSWSYLDSQHTFGSHLAQKGESLYKITELMGNSPDICRRHYAALIPEKMHDVVEFEKAEQPDETEALLRQFLARLDQVATALSPLPFPLAT